MMVKWIRIIYISVYSLQIDLQAFASELLILYVAKETIVFFFFGGVVTISIPKVPQVFYLNGSPLVFTVSVSPLST